MHITDECNSSKVKELIANYRSHNIVEIAIELNIVLRDNILIY